MRAWSLLLVCGPRLHRWSDRAVAGVAVAGVRPARRRRPTAPPRPSPRSSRRIPPAPAGPHGCAPPPATAGSRRWPARTSAAAGDPAPGHPARAPPPRHPAPARRRPRPAYPRRASADPAPCTSTAPCPRSCTAASSTPGTHRQPRRDRRPDPPSVTESVSALTDVLDRWSCRERRCRRSAARWKPSATTSRRRLPEGPRPRQRRVRDPDPATSHPRQHPARRRPAPGSHIVRRDRHGISRRPAGTRHGHSDACSVFARMPRYAPAASLDVAARGLGGFPQADGGRPSPATAS